MIFHDFYEKLEKAIGKEELKKLPPAKNTEPCKKIFMLMTSSTSILEKECEYRVKRVEMIDKIEKKISEMINSSQDNRIDFIKDLDHFIEDELIKECPNWDKLKVTLNTPNYRDAIVECFKNLLKFVRNKWEYENPYINKFIILLNEFIEDELKNKKENPDWDKLKIKFSEINFTYIIIIKYFSSELKNWSNIFGVLLCTKLRDFHNILNSKYKSQFKSLDYFIKNLDEFIKNEFNKDELKMKNENPDWNKLKVIFSNQNYRYVIFERLKKEQLFVEFKNCENRLQVINFICHLDKFIEDELKEDGPDWNRLIVTLNNQNYQDIVNAYLKNNFNKFKDNCINYLKKEYVDHGNLIVSFIDEYFKNNTNKIKDNCIKYFKDEYVDPNDKRVVIIELCKDLFSEEPFQSDVAKIIEYLNYLHLWGQIFIKDDQFKKYHCNGKNNNITIFAKKIHNYLVEHPYFIQVINELDQTLQDKIYKEFKADLDDFSSENYLGGKLACLLKKIIDEAGNYKRKNSRKSTSLS